MCLLSLWLVCCFSFSPRYPRTFSVVCGGRTALDLRPPTGLAEVGWFGTADGLTHLGSSRHLVPPIWSLTRTTGGLCGFGFGGAVASLWRKITFKVAHSLLNSRSRLLGVRRKTTASELGKGACHKAKVRVGQPERGSLLLHFCVYVWACLCTCMCHARHKRQSRRDSRNSNKENESMNKYQENFSD